MATDTLYLRPSADISLGHSITPADSGLEYGYMAISEEVADGISSALMGNSDEEYISTFVFSGNIPSEKIKITDIKIGYVYRYSSSNATSIDISSVVYFNDMSYPFESATEFSSDFALFTSEMWSDLKSDFLNDLNQCIENGTIKNALQMEIKMTTLASATKLASYFITQVYVELTYEEITGLGIYTKQNGTWLQAQKAYQKQNGAWVEISEDECKSILQSNRIITC